MYIHGDVIMQATCHTDKLMTGADDVNFNIANQRGAWVLRPFLEILDRSNS